ncbi:cytochrome P450 6a22-like [Musca domestica]|uniref:Cytochrome P450 6a22-like n=1 Tax=Musca domestica TaxID=7370 RepID=A0A9J7IG07_MUSDO|nr:cytochrome P450 6a22-like [Musca domestica]
MLDFISLALLLLTSLLLIFFNYRRKIAFWKRQNVDLLGVWYMLGKSRRQHLFEILDELYRQMKVEGKPCKVIETSLTTSVILQDHTAITEVLTSKFEKFPERGFYVNNQDPLMANLVRYKYDLWKPLRRKLAPAFTPAKLKYMFPTMTQVGERFVKIVTDELERSADGILEMHDWCKRFSMDVIGTIAFGIEVNCLEDGQNQFKTRMEKALVEHFRPLTDQICVKYPRLMNLLNFKYHSRQSIEFFGRLVQDTVEYREKYKVRRNDFLDLLLECRDNEDEFQLTMDMIVGHVFIFFIGGYESSSTALCQALYELAKKPELQEKARMEVQQVVTSQKVSYENLKSLKYVKQVIMETLRKYPIVPAMLRLCRESCSLNTKSGPLEIPEGATLMLPIYSIHNDEDFYPNPKEFLPERFEESSEKQRPTHTFLTFGDGPRNCIAFGFGVMELLYALSTLLVNFRFTLSEKSPKVIEFDRNTKYIASLSSGIYLKVEKI